MDYLEEQYNKHQSLRWAVFVLKASLITLILLALRQLTEGKEMNYEEFRVVWAVVAIGGLWFMIDDFREE